VPSKEKKRYSIRFTLDNPIHALAWEKISKIPTGRKNNYLISCILESNTSSVFEEIVRRVTEETLEKYSDTILVSSSNNTAIDTNVKTIEINEDEKTSINPEVMGFLKGL